MYVPVGFGRKPGEYTWKPMAWRVFGCLERVLSLTLEDYLSDWQFDFVPTLPSLKQTYHIRSLESGWLEYDRFLLE